MTELKHVLVEELLNALDDIQNDIPDILDYYMDTELVPEDNIHMDMDLLAMNITGLRDSAKLIRESIHTNKPITCGPRASVDNGAPESFSISPQVKQVALAMFLHTHMLTDPESIYNSNIICGNHWCSYEPITNN
jgi:hypothetical protein